MFYKFNAHRARKDAAKPDTVAGKQIFKKLLLIQQGWADFMHLQAAKLSTTWLKSLSLTVLTLSAGYCIYLISDGMLSLNGGKAPVETGPLWPFDPFKVKQRLRAQSTLHRYLDSLENAVVTDSLNQSKLNPK